MRLINLMTFVCLLILLALLPACLQFAKWCGLNPPVALSAVAVLVIVAGLFAPRS